MAKSASKSKQTYSTLYKSTSRWKSNRERRLLKLLKSQPNNEQIKIALKQLVYRRGTPSVPFWSHSMIREAALFKEFTGYVNKDIFSSNEKVRENARLHHHCKHFTNLPEGKVDFSLGARVGNGPGKSTWK